jgi:hypothetical protein
MSSEIEYTTTFSDFARSARHAKAGKYRRGLTRAVSIAIGLCLLAAGGWLLKGASDWSDYLTSTVLLLMGLLITLWSLVPSLAFKTLMRSSLLASQTWGAEFGARRRVVVDDDGLTTHSSHRTEIRFWSSISDIEVERRGLFFYGIDNAQAMHVPANTFASRQQLQRFHDDAVSTWNSRRTARPSPPKFPADITIHFAIGESEQDAAIAAMQAYRLKQIAQPSNRNRIGLRAISWAGAALILIPGIESAYRYHDWTLAVLSLLPIVSTEMFSRRKKPVSAEPNQADYQARMRRMRQRMAGKPGGDRLGMIAPYAPLGSQTLMVGSSGMCLFDSSRRRFIEWPGASGVLDAGGIVIILDGSRALFAIPTEAFDDARLRTEFLSYARSHLPAPVAQTAN